MQWSRERIPREKREEPENEGFKTSRSRCCLALSSPPGSKEQMCFSRIVYFEVTGFVLETNLAVNSPQLHSHHVLRTTW